MAILTSRRGAGPAGRRASTSLAWARPLTALVAVCGGACAPDIGPGAYYCGPDLACPPGLACDQPTFTCESAAAARPFACPPGSEDAEPDDTPEQAADLGAVVCGEPLVVDQGFEGCIADRDQVDVLTFRSDAACEGDPILQIVLQFPIASAPLAVDLLDGDGRVVSRGSDCTPIPDFTGTERRCIELIPGPSVYYLRIAGDRGGSDCDGACGHNQYALTIFFPLA